ncbi:hypothetical protein CLV36_104192 [Laceyella sediminis]|uniref:Uncharacterized protein n=1 Tax=Laceyella sediminis TaxID=573074 RepID=A0ABX5ESK4_9BACL|nr:hypothetical protein [Laceyella sediminis]PRZ15467.1 hypothetical protein CLV36_104192 [Laceyella sediminis]
MKLNIKCIVVSMLTITLGLLVNAVLWITNKLTFNQFFSLAVFLFIILFCSMELLVRYVIKSNEEKFELYNLIKVSPSLWLHWLNHTDKGIKLIRRFRFGYIGCIILFVFFIIDQGFIRWIYSIYPHHKFSPEVDAAIITTMGSTVTLGLTLIVTFYFNRQTQLAMIEQSRANLKERVIEKRMTLYPEIEQEIEKIWLLYPKGINTNSWKKAVSKLNQLYQENKYYLSQNLRKYIFQVLTFAKADHQEELSPEEIKEAEQKLNELVELCQIEIEKSLDLATLVDLD